MLNAALTKSATNSNEAVWWTCSKNGATDDTYVERLRATGSISHSTRTRCRQALVEETLHTNEAGPETFPIKSLVRLTRQNGRICTKYKLHMISGSRREANENFALLGHYAASSGNSFLTFQGNLSVPSSWVKNPPPPPKKKGAGNSSTGKCVGDDKS
jgi:hypothetical protein